MARFVTNELAGAMVGPGQFLFLLFVGLYAMHYFLMRGPVLVEAVLSATPLLPADRRLLMDKFMTGGGG